MPALFLAELESEVAQALPELLDLQHAITCIVQDFKHTLQADKSTRTSRGQLLTQFRNQLIVFVLDACVASSSVARRTKLILVRILVVDGIGTGGSLTREDLITRHGEL